MDHISELNQIILDSLPHWAMLINVKNRTVLAANKLARQVGSKIECQCWDDFGHRQFLSDEHKSLIEREPDRKRDNEIKCDFCLADEAMEKNTPKQKEVEIEDVIWDTWWVPVDKDMYLHYAIDITDIRKAEAAKLKAAQLESAMKTVAAVCHTINQPLQVLTTALDMMEDDLDHDLIPEAQSCAQAIGKTTRKLQKLFQYQTKEHIDGTEILDIDASSK